MGKRLIATSEEMVQFGEEVGMTMSPNGILALSGELGAGKTTFVQGLLKGLGSDDMAQSPTFTYLQIYEGKVPVYHFDLYRLKSSEEFIALGFEEFLSAGGVTVIEWPERITSLIPEAKWITLEHCNEGRMYEIR